MFSWIENISNFFSTVYDWFSQLFDFFHYIQNLFQNSFDLIQNCFPSAIAVIFTVILSILIISKVLGR